MPLYEYACRSCGTHTDIRHGFDDTNSDPCPACGGELARVFGAGGIVFKGSGFYINDSKSSGGRTNAGESKASGDVKSESSETPKSDAGASKSDSSKSGTAA